MRAAKVTAKTRPRPPSDLPDIREDFMMTFFSVVSQFLLTRTLAAGTEKR